MSDKEALKQYPNLFANAFHLPYVSTITDESEDVAVSPILGSADEWQAGTVLVVEYAPVRLIRRNLPSFEFPKETK